MGKRIRANAPLVCVLLALLALLAGCTRGADPDAQGNQDGSSSGSGANAEAGATSVLETAPPAPLQFLQNNATVFCDGNSQIAGEVRGAVPGEIILFESTLPVAIEQGLADANGNYVLTWTCQPAEARLKWDVSAMGHDSGRRVAFIVTGAPEDPELARVLLIDVVDQPFVCDGRRSVVGGLTGAEPFEKIIFESEQVANLNDGDTDVNGETPIYWRCDVDEAGAVWQINARGAQSGKSGEFTITAAPPGSAAPQELAAQAIEEPFVCNGLVRPAAKITGLVPFEVVDFSSNESSALIDGAADGVGELVMRWQCDREDIGKTWTVAASGVSSGGKISVTITGGAPPEGTFKDIAIAFTEDPFLCDSNSRQFAVLSHFLSREFIDFDSPDSGPLRQGQADDTGSLPIRWQCEPNEAGKTWQVTATGTTSKKTITFTVTAAL